MGFREHLVGHVRSYLNQDPQEVKDCVGTTAVIFQNMSDDGTDSMYQEPARRLRRIESKIDNNERLTDIECMQVAEAIIYSQFNSP